MYGKNSDSKKIVNEIDEMQNYLLQCIVGSVAISGK